MSTMYASILQPTRLHHKTDIAPIARTANDATQTRNHAYFRNWQLYDLAWHRIVYDPSYRGRHCRVPSLLGMVNLFIAICLIAPTFCSIRKRHLNLQARLFCAPSIQRERLETSSLVVCERYSVGIPAAIALAGGFLRNNYQHHSTHH